MTPKQKYYFVNWIDGMKINKDHFIGMENAMIYQQQVGSKLCIYPYNFGILPRVDGESSVDISFGIDSGNRVQIKINRCKAVTAGGFIIDIDTTSPELSVFEISLKDGELQIAESASGQFYVVLKINPYNRVPVGNADPAENPPRHPYTVPEFGVFLIPVEQMNKSGFGEFFLVTGKILIKDHIPYPDTEYIAPSSSVSSDERLLAYENKITAFFDKLESDIFVIIHKIHIKQQKTPLVNTLLYLADKMVSFLGMHITEQRLYLTYLPPVSLFEAIIRFACFLRNTLNTQPPEYKEEMINYFSDWCNLKQGELEKLLNDTTSCKYNHYEIAAIMSKLMYFVDTISTLFGTLSTLDYIGKHKDTQIYIKEEVKQKKSFLADD